MSKGRYFCGGSALAVTLVLSFGATQAMAQSQDAAPTVSEVVTTGTYIRGAAEDTAIAVEVTTRADLLNQGSPSLTQLARGMSEIGNTLQGDTAHSGGNPGQTTLNLRNLGSNRTLVLLNGVRLASESSGSTNGDTQNISVIPTNVLQQVEQLKDGGASTYGSSAVAGVVNFRTRTDLNGVEASASYNYVKGGAGDYNADIQWGRRNDNGNVLIDMNFSRTGELRANARDFTKQPPLLSGSTSGVSGGWSYISAPGSYAFADNSGTAFAPNAAATKLPGATATDPFILGSGAKFITGQTGQNTTTLSSNISSTAYAVRDPLCNAYGGFRGWTQAGGGGVSPACATNYVQSEDLNFQTDRYGIFADANFDVNDKWRLNSSFNFSKSVIPFFINAGIIPGTTAPCDPYDDSILNGSTGVAQNCISQGAQGLVPPSPTQYYVSGYNPATLDFMNKANTSATTSSAAMRYFTQAQVDAVTSCLPGVTATNCGGTDAPGRTNLRTSTWSPFGLGGIGVNDPMFHNGQQTQRVENNSFLTSNSLKGDLGEVFGTQLDLKVSGSYTHNFTNTSGQGILIDRLQRALNGFATNLDDHSGTGGQVDHCTAGETYGSRPNATYTSSTAAVGATNKTPTGVTGTANSIIVTNTSATGGAGTQTTYTASVPFSPFAVGAGGGWGDVDGAANGSLIGAGNGCYFFNPYASALTQIKYGGGNAVQGSATSYGFINTGFYQGYGFDPSQMTLANGVYTPKTGAVGTGLTNQNGIVNWLFANRWSRLTQDTIDLQAVLNGTGGFNLKGGPLAWALGTEYRYYRRDSQYDNLSNGKINPCTFIQDVSNTQFGTAYLIADQNDINVVGKNNIGGSSPIIINGAQIINPATGQTAVYTRNGSTTENVTAACTNISNTQLTTNSGNQAGVWADGFGGTEAAVKEDRSIAGFMELQLPLLDKLHATFASRYERDRINLSTPVAAVVNSFQLSYAFSSGITLRGNIGQTFQNLDCSCTSGLSSTSLQSTSNLLGGTLLQSEPDQGTRADVYGNTALGPERGSNFSFGVVYHPNSSLLATLDLVNIKIVGRSSTLSAGTVARILANKSGVGQQLETADLTKNICSASSTLFAAQAGSITAGQPIVQLINPLTGATQLACTTAVPNVTLNGASIGGTDYDLLFSLPSRVNTGSAITRQLDEHVEYTLPNPVLGGRLQMTVDGTYMLFLNQDPGSYAGAILGVPTKYRGVFSGDTASQTASPFRGTLGFVWQKGKNTLNVQTHWAGAVADSSAGAPVNIVATAIGTNYNPIPSKVSGCTPGIISLLAPDPRMTGGAVDTALGQPGLGEGSINTSCNIGNYTGEVVPGFVSTDLTYIRQLPGRTSVSINVDNIFDKDPPYQKGAADYFAPYATGNAFGRTVKVAIRKSF